MSSQKFATPLHYVDKCMISVTSAQEMKATYINLSEVQGIDEGSKFADKGTGGPNDSRLGVIEQKKICPTCGLTAISSTNVNGCFGHMGYIVLKDPVYNPMFFKNILDLLKIFCLKCKGFIIKKEAVKTIFQQYDDPTLRIRELKKKATLKTCSNCQETVNPRINYTVKQKTLEPVIYQNVDDGEKAEKGAKKEKKGKEISIKTILNFLQSIEEGNWRALMGDVNYKPQDLMFHKYFPISPPHVRPNNKTPGSEVPIAHKSTLMYSNIVNHVERNDTKDVYKFLYNIFGQQIRAKKGADTLGDNQYNILKNFEGKAGIFRKNMLGRRIDNTARTVIDPDTSIDIDEVGVPFRICKRLLVKEIVTEANKERLTRMMHNARRDVYPSLVYLVENRGDDILKKAFSRMGKPIDLQVGMVVHRQAIKGDFLFINRQPTLHRASIMVMRMVPKPGYSLRLNPGSCGPLNADFDGDELNNYMSIDQTSQVLALNKMHISKSFLSLSSSEPIVQPNHDSILGIYRLSKNYGSFIFTREEVRQMLSYAYLGDDEEPVQPEKEMLGNEILALMFPRFLRKKVLDLSQHNKGGIPKKVLVNLSKDIYFNSKQSTDITKFLNRILRLSYWIQNIHLSTFGIWDCFVDLDRRDFFNKVLEMDTKTNEMITQKQNLYYQNAKYEDVNIDAYTFGTAYELNEKETDNAVNIFKGYSQRIVTKETYLNNYNTTFDDEVRKLYKASAEDVKKIPIMSRHAPNNYIELFASGAKGKPMNIRCVMAVIGMQAIDGKRPKCDTKDRLSCHYPVHDGLYNRGYISDCFSYGISDLTGFMNHISAGRTGLIATALGTGKTGYIFRRLDMFFRGIRIGNNNDVRFGEKILQTSYGCNNVDIRYQKRMKLAMMTMPFEKIRKSYFEGARSQGMSDLYELCRQLVTKYRSIRKMTNFDDQTVVGEFYHSFQYDNILEQAKIIEAEKPVKASTATITEEEYLECIALYKQKIIIVPHPRNPQNYKSESNEEMLEIFLLFFVENYSYAFCVANKINNALLHTCIDVMKRLYDSYRVSPGELVGILAAQSIGENFTQSTLDAFHSSGGSSAMQDIQAVPAFEALISNSQDANTFFTLKLKKAYKYDRKYAQNLLDAMLSIKLESVVGNIQVFFDPLHDQKGFSFLMNSGTNTEYAHQINSNSQTPITDQNAILEFCDAAPMMLVMNIEYGSKYYEGIFNDIFVRVSNYLFAELPKQTSIVPDVLIMFNNPESSSGQHGVPDKLIIRFGLTETSSKVVMYDFFNMMVRKVQLKGIEGITRAQIQQQDKVTFDRETGEMSKKTEFYILVMSRVADFYVFKDFKYVDYNNCFTNDMVLMGKSFSICEMSRILYRTVCFLFEFLKIGQFPQNLLFVALVKTFKARVLTINRNMITSFPSQDFMSATSFEQPVKFITRGALKNSVADTNKSIISSLILNANVKCGYGSFDVGRGIDINKEGIRDVNIYIDYELLLDCVDFYNGALLEY